MSKNVNKGGRPHLAPELKRDRRVTINFTQSEYENLIKKSERLKMPLNGFLRASIKNTEIKEAPELLPDFIQSLAQLNNNINQIARQINAYGIRDDVMIKKYTEAVNGLAYVIENIKNQFLKD